MKERTFMAILLALLTVSILFTAAHLIYDVYAYGHCSIIYFIGRELW